MAKSSPDCKYTVSERCPTVVSTVTEKSVHRGITFKAEKPVEPVPQLNVQLSLSDVSP